MTGNDNPRGQLNYLYKPILRRLTWIKLNRTWKWISSFARASGKYLEAQVLVRKHPVSIALSNRVLEKVDHEASKQKRSRSEYVELHSETLFFKPLEQ
jgi:hypothetical protein